MQYKYQDIQTVSPAWYLNESQQEAYTNAKRHSTHLHGLADLGIPAIALFLCVHQDEAEGKNQAGFAPVLHISRKFSPKSIKLLLKDIQMAKPVLPGKRSITTAPWQSTLLSVYVYRCYPGQCSSYTYDHVQLASLFLQRLSPAPVQFTQGQTLGTHVRAIYTQHCCTSVWTRV